MVVFCSSESESSFVLVQRSHVRAESTKIWYGGRSVCLGVGFRVWLGVFWGLRCKPRLAWLLPQIRTSKLLSCSASVVCNSFCLSVCLGSLLPICWPLHSQEAFHARLACSQVRTSLWNEVVGSVLLEHCFQQTAVGSESSSVNPCIRLFEFYLAPPHFSLVAPKRFPQDVPPHHSLKHTSCCSTWVLLLPQLFTCFLAFGQHSG